MLKIAHLYPKQLNLYGDGGNIMALSKRLEWRGIDFQVDQFDLDDEKRITDYHLFFIGGGQDSGQELVAVDLFNRKKELSDFIEAGGTALAICGGYQLLGKSYETSDGSIMQGLGILDCETRAPSSTAKFQDRLIGNVVAELLLEMEVKTLVGFENHSGRTYLGASAKPLAKVIKGYGNNGEDGFEGAVYNSLGATYLHGSVLPKNPHLADELLRRAISFAGLELELKLLDDQMEIRAHEALL